MADATATEGQGAPPAEQQGGTPTVNVKELLGQLEPEVRNVAQTAINTVAKRLTDSFTEKEASLTAKIAALEEQNASFTEFRQGIEQSLSGDDDTPPDQITEIERQLTPPAWCKTQEQKRIWVDMARDRYLRDQRITQLTEANDTSRTTIAELQKQIADDRKERQEIEKARANALLDAELARAAADLSVVSAVGFDRFHRANCVYEPKSGVWVYQVGEEKLPLRTGLEKHTEDWLRKPIVQEGGSGSRGGRSADPEAELKAARQDLATAEQRASATRNERDIALWQAHKRKVRELEAAKAA